MRQQSGCKNNMFKKNIIMIIKNVLAVLFLSSLSSSTVKLATEIIKENKCYSNDDDKSLSIRPRVHNIKYLENKIMFVV